MKNDIFKRSLIILIVVLFLGVNIIPIYNANNIKLKTNKTQQSLKDNSFTITKSSSNSPSKNWTRMFYDDADF